MLAVDPDQAADRGAGGARELEGDGPPPRSEGAPPQTKSASAEGPDQGEKNHRRHSIVKGAIDALQAKNATTKRCDVLRWLYHLPTQPSPITGVDVTPWSFRR